jgi:type II secretory pathway pseudopilin PulG
MPFYLWLILSVLGAAAASAVVYAVLQSRFDVKLSRERQALAEVRGQIEAQRLTLEHSLKSMEESTRRKALEEFLADMRVEERRYVRQHKILFLNRKSLVVQERIFFRNIPLSNWVEQERVLEEGADIDEVAKTLSIFDPGLLLGGAGAVAKKLLT